MTMTESVYRIAVCYPTKSLSAQMARWGRWRSDSSIEPVFDRSAMAIRRSLDGVDVALVDASDDHAQAIDLFSQAIARLGARRVAVYTETMHEGLELFVRTQGAWLLLGPLSIDEWEDFFTSMLPTSSREPADEPRFPGAGAA